MRTSRSLGTGAAVALAATLAATLAAAGACRAPRAVSAQDALAARRLVGTWDARFRIASPRSGRASDSAPTARGELAFVPARALSRVSGLDAPTEVGSYDVDFSPVGFDASAPGHAPVAVADASARDSVRLMLDPGGTRPVVWMHGRWVGDSVVGRWRVDLGRAAERGGTFTLARSDRP